MLSLTTSLNVIQDPRHLAGPDRRRRGRAERRREQEALQDDDQHGDGQHSVPRRRRQEHLPEEQPDLPQAGVGALQGKVLILCVHHFIGYFLITIQGFQ